MEIMGSLVDSSLVRAEPHDDEPPFSLLDTVREYALDRLRDSGDWEGVHDRHAAYFAALARPAESELSGPGQLDWVNRLESVPARYQPRCLRTCELAGFCRDEARMADTLTVLGSVVRDDLGGLDTVSTALALARGERAPSDDQADIMRALRHAKQLSDSLAGGAA